MSTTDLTQLTTDPLTSGQAALTRGAWEEARACFEAAVAKEETAEAIEGLSWAAWWLNDAETTFEAREHAFRVYRERGDRRSAARMAIWIAADYVDFRGETAIANGWRQRARRLLDGLEPTPEHGWLAVHEGDFAILMEDDTVTARRLGKEATELGRSLEILDLEMAGLALEGLALVSEGYVDEGMRQLDEATAAAVAGEFQEIAYIGWAYCYLIYACERVRDYERAAQWCKQMEEYARRLNVRLALGICRTHYAGVLMWRGVWDEAERELTLATEDLAASRPPYAGEGIVRLAELRRLQDRLEEAETLFDQVEGHPLERLGRAALALDRNDPATAVELLERLLRRLSPETRTERVASLELLVRAHISLGDVSAAEKLVVELETIALTLGTEPLRASVAVAEGLIAAARGHHETARDRFEAAVDWFGHCGAAFELARARVGLARALCALDHPDLAKQEATLALRSLETLGATAEVRRATELLAEIASAALQPRAARTQSILTRRELDVLRCIAQGLSDKEVADQLILSEHTVHRHVANILRKLSVHSRAAAVANAAQLGLL